MSATAIAISANTTAAIAAQQAEQAARVACQGMMPTYTHQSATVEQMHNYASCVSKLYPDPMDSSTIIILKIALILIILGMIGGAVYGWREDKLIGAFIGVIIGACIAFGAELVLAALLWAVSFIVS